MKQKEELQKIRSKLEQKTSQLEVVQEHLAHAEKLLALGKLSASIAHEFKNPIQGIRLCLEDLVENNALKDSEKKLIRVAIKECDRMNQLTNNLKDFYRPSRKKSSLVNIHNTIDELLQLCGKKLKTNKIKVIKDFAEGLPSLYVVEDQIKQVFLNFITNAEEAIASSGGKLTIQTRVLDNKLHIIFQDTGIGIAKKDISKIFDPFFTTKVATKGTGLGLSVSYGIIKKHKGKVWVESAPYKGSKFTLELPLPTK